MRFFIFYLIYNIQTRCGDQYLLCQIKIYNKKKNFARVCRATKSIQSQKFSRVTHQTTNNPKRKKEKKSTLNSPNYP